MQTPVQPKLCKFCYGAIAGHLEGDGKLASQTLRCSTHRNREEDDSEDGAVTYSTPLSVFSQDSCNSDTDGNGHEFFSAKSSPIDSPSRARDSRESSSYLRRRRMEEDMLENVSEFAYGNLAVCNEDGGQKAQPLLDFENNSQIWYPPPALVVEDDVEMLFRDEDEDGYASDLGMALPSARFSSEGLLVKEKPNHANKERLRSTLREHFTALVAQLLEEEGLQFESEDGGDGWLEIVSSLAWQAANFVKPDTSKGDSMDPGSYVKVKCISSGSPSDSMLVKGIVCTKNIKHKHMVSQHKNPRLLILGGALGVPNRLASMKTVHEQETDYLIMAVSKIEAHRPNVLLVEKTVSSYVQEYLLTREISLVLNVKRALLERISRCTGAQIASSVDNLASVRTGQCEMFRIVKEECLSSSSPSKKFVKTLMFFEGCPRRLGCTILLKGARLEELKKVKGVIQFASFAAYHLSLESSYLADEGATLPKFPFISPSLPNLPQDDSDEHKKVKPLGIKCSSSCSNISSIDENIMRINNEQDESEDTISGDDVSHLSLPDPRNGDYIVRSTRNLASGGSRRSTLKFQCKEPEASSQYRTGAKIYEGKMLKRYLANPCDLGATGETNVNDTTDMSCHPSPYFSAADNRESILVSLSSSCISKGTVCERSRLFRIKFYSISDKPLGQYLRDDLFGQTSSCQTCQEPVETHVRCYMHQQGSLTISVKRLPSVKLSGALDGRIWMWHRCLKCERKDGVPPAAHRVVMSDPAWGLSFGKFLELSFSNNRTANRVADCGHSLQRDCLRFYGLGSMVAFFRYSPVDILSVNLPPLVLDFSCDVQPECMRREAALISSKLEYLHGAVGNVLCDIEQRMTTSDNDRLNASIQEHISDLRDLLKRERYKYDVLLHSVSANNTQSLQTCLDTLELNRWGRSLLIDSYTWDRRLHLLDSISKGENSSSNVNLQLLDSFTHSKLEGLRNETFRSYGSVEKLPEEVEMKLSTVSRVSRNSTSSKHHEEASFQVLECNSNNLVEMDMSIESVDGYIGPAGVNLVSGQSFKWDEKQIDAEDHNDTLFDEGVRSPENNLSDKIDLLWTGSIPILSSSTSISEADSVGSLMDNPRNRKLRSPARVYSFDSALRYQNKVSGTFALKSFDTSGNFVKDPLQNMRQAYTQRSLRATRSLNIGNNEMPSASPMVTEGARFLLSRPGLGNIVILVYDDDPTSIISYAISSQEHTNFIVGKSEGLRENETNRVGNYFDRSSTLAPHEYSSHFHDDLRSQFYGSNDPQQLRGRVYPDPKESHFRFSFEDDSSIPSDKVKFSVTCYFARQFDALRRKCCPNEVDFIRSLSRCKPWKAQGGKSNVYFARSWDERFIIKQVTKTELDSFEEFAPEYFKYLTESINNGSPTCLAKVLGIYQVNVKHLKGGREMKLDLIVMENLFFQRNISRVYDLKGSARSRYNPDTSVNKVLLDLNLLETLRTKPIFLGSKAKRTLERAVWNDTSFLASIDVMDYSLLVGVDEEKNELVIGIIDFMRQYTWDKHLETWVKASGILGGPKNVSPTVVSPKEYKKRFRKAMSSYFLTFPDQWSS